MYCLVEEGCLGKVCALMDLSKIYVHSILDAIKFAIFVKYLQFSLYDLPTRCINLSNVKIVFNQMPPLFGTF